MKKIKTLVVALLSFIMVFTAACTPAPHTHTDADSDSVCDTCGETLPGGGTGGGPQTPMVYAWDGATHYSYFEDDDAYQDSSELPDYEGSTLQLEVWKDFLVDTSKASTSDVVSPEIARITGVSIDQTNVQTNTGGFQTKLSQIVSSGQYPDIAYASEATGINIVQSDIVKDLTNLLPIYAPNLYARMMAVNNGSIFSSNCINGGVRGMIYGIPYAIGDVDLTNSHLNFNSDVVNSNAASSYQGVNEKYKYVYVRDDIMVKVYEYAVANPSAGYDKFFQKDAQDNLISPKRVSDLSAKYLNGEAYTEEDIFDIDINSEAEYMEFLRAVKVVIDHYDIKENGKPVEVTYASCGTDTDTWNLMQMMFSAVQGRPSGIDQMFTYWDREEEEVLLMLEQDFFKQSIKYWYQAINDGTIDRECLAVNNKAFLEKVNAGRYAITYPYNMPNNVAFETANKGYQYRKLYINIPQADRFAYMATQEPKPSCIYIFKDVSDEDTKQILMWMDFQCTVIADRLWAWGPGGDDALWEYKYEGGEQVYDAFGDPQRVFKSEYADLENYMVNQLSVINDITLNYNLYNGKITSNSKGFICPYFINGASDQLPSIRYPQNAKQLKASEYANAYTTVAVFGEAEIDQVKKLPTLWLWYVEVPELKKCWLKRQTIESALVQILGATSDADFESRYNNMVNIVKSPTGDVKLTDDVLVDLDIAFKEANRDFMDNIVLDD